MSINAPTLWELGESLSEAFAAVDALLSENDGEYTPEMAALIDGAQEDWEEKALRTGFYADRKIPMEIDAIAREVARLRARSRALTKRRAWLKETYLPEALARQGRTHVHSALLTLRIDKGRVRVIIDTLPEFLNPDFVRVKRVVEANKKAILAALEAGKKVEGAHLEKVPVAKVS